MIPNFLSEGLRQTMPGVLLVVLRVYLGVVFLVASWPKVTAGTAWGSRMTAFLEQAMPRSYEFYQSFLQSVVIPNAQIFGFLVTYGELLVGVVLVLGIATRLAALAGLVMTLNYMLVKGATLWMASSNDAAFSFIGLVIMLGGAGRALGIDYFLAQKCSKLPLW